jgi:hypothetical protein
MKMLTGLKSFWIDKLMRMTNKRLNLNCLALMMMINNLCYYLELTKIELTLLNSVH